MGGNKHENITSSLEK